MKWFAYLIRLLAFVLFTVVGTNTAFAVPMAASNIIYFQLEPSHIVQADDVGGHIQACRHGGTCDRFNLFPQNSNFNNSAYKKWENEITRSLQNGDNVGNVTVKLNRADPHNVRPDSVKIEYEINGVPFEKKFSNQAGQ